MCSINLLRILLPMIVNNFFFFFYWQVIKDFRMACHFFFYWQICPPMAPHHLLHFILLLLIFLLGVAWIGNKNDDESSSESLNMMERWTSPEDGEGDSEEAEHFSSETITVQQEASLACRCWSTSAIEFGSILETECKCRGHRISSVPSTLPTDVHRL